MNSGNKCNNKLFLLLIVINVMLFTLGIGKNEDGKIFKNIHIQKIDISNLTKDQAINQIKKNHYPKSINIKYNDKKWTINPEDIDLDYNIERSVEKAYQYTREEKTSKNISKMFNLTFKDELNIKLHASYNEARLSEIINKIAKEINVDVQNAKIQIKDNYEIVRTDSKEGIEVNIISLKESIYNMIGSKNISQIELPIKIIKPIITTEDVNSINNILGEYGTSFYDHSSRGSNIHVAGKSTSDILIMPGETFSYNEATGARNWSNGYKSAKVIIGGKYVNGEGGGVCQVSTTIYNAALLAGMQIEEVHNHTMPSHYASVGRDAAVSYGYTDFKFKNPYSHPIYIKNTVGVGGITSKIYGCSYDKQRIYVKTEPKYNKDSINVKTYRVYLDQDNNKIREELIAQSKYKNK